MASIIQNLACFEVRFNEKSGRFYFDEDILQGKTIKNIWLFFANQDAAIRSPFSVSTDDLELPSIENIENQSGVYLNIVDPSGKEIIKNLSFTNISLDTETPWKQVKSYTEILIDRKIDTKKSFFNSFVPNVSDFIFLMYVSYETKAQSIQNFDMRGSFTVEIPIPENAEIYDVRLSDYVPREYQTKKIKQILFSNPYTRSYLSINADNSFIENIPSALLFNSGTTKNIFFDLLNIDYEESYLRYRGVFGETDKETITFLY